MKLKETQKRLVNTVDQALKSEKFDMESAKQKMDKNCKIIQDQSSRLKTNDQRLSVMTSKYDKLKLHHEQYKAQMERYEKSIDTWEKMESTIRENTELKKAFDQIDKENIKLISHKNNKQKIKYNMKLK